MLLRLGIIIIVIIIVVYIIIITIIIITQIPHFTAVYLVLKTVSDLNLSYSPLCHKLTAISEDIENHCFTHWYMYIYRLRWSRGSVLAFGTQVRGFKPGRSLGFLRAKKFSARLLSEGKYSRLSHVADLRHVKDL